MPEEHTPLDKPSSPIRVLILDDHAMVREALISRLGQESDLVVVGAAGELCDGEPLLRRLHPDVMILDLMLGAADGLSVLQSWKQKFPHTAFLALSATKSDSVVLRALGAGASGFVCKTDPVDHLLASIRAVASGRKLQPTHVSDNLRTARRDGKFALTTRELEIMRQIASGLCSREIAKILGISVKTVDRHRENLRAKLNLPNSSALLREAIVLFPPEAVGRG